MQVFCSHTLVAQKRKDFVQQNFITHHSLAEEIRRMIYENKWSKKKWWFYNAAIMDFLSKGEAYILRRSRDVAAADVANSLEELSLSVLNKMKSADNLGEESQDLTVDEDITIPTKAAGLSGKSADVSPASHRSKDRVSRTRVQSRK